jgi:two-component system chemotaxis sensor kinase CheA
MYNPVETFLQEADELLAEIEQTALALSGGDSTGESVNQLFRAFHTIKGSGAMFGFTEVAAFTHHMETLLDGVRTGSIPASPELAELVLAASDRIKVLLTDGPGSAARSDGAGARLVERMERLLPPPREQSPMPQPAKGAGAEAAREWSIRFKPNPGWLACGGNPVLLFRELAEMGDCAVSAHTEDLPELDQLEPDVCYCWWTLELRTGHDCNAIRDVFLFVEDGS